MDSAQYQQYKRGEIRLIFLCENCTEERASSWGGDSSTHEHEEKQLSPGGITDVTARERSTDGAQLPHQASPIAQNPNPTPQLTIVSSGTSRGQEKLVSSVVMSCLT